MKLNADISEIPWKKVSIVLVLLIVLGGGAYAGWSVYNKVPSHPTSPEDNKTAVSKYLQKRGERSSYQPLLEVAREKNPWNTLKSQYDEPPDYKTVYRNIGEHLATAAHLINQSESRDQANGIRIAAELCDIAIDVAVDPWLAARICDAYIMPNLDKIEEKPKSGLSREQYMNIASKIYREANENERLIELGKAYLAQTAPGLRADQIRYRLARSLEQKGDYKEALKYLHEISHASLTNEANRRVTIIQQNMARTAKK